MRAVLARWWAWIVMRAAVAEAVPADAMRQALLDWAYGDRARAAFVATLDSWAGGHWMREAAGGELAPWFPRTDDLGMSGRHDLMVSPDLTGLARAVALGRVHGTPEDLRALRRGLDICHSH